MPLDPWDQPYQYAYPGTHEEGKPDIWSMGPDMLMEPTTTSAIGRPRSKWGSRRCRDAARRHGEC